MEYVTWKNATESGSAQLTVVYSRLSCQKTPFFITSALQMQNEVVYPNLDSGYFEVQIFVL